MPIADIRQNASVVVHRSDCIRAYAPTRVRMGVQLQKVVGSGGFTLSLSAFEVRVEKAFRMHAISIAHQTGFKNRIAQQFLNSFWQMARFVRRHGQQKRLQLPQPGLAVLYRDP